MNQQAEEYLRQASFLQLLPQEAYEKGAAAVARVIA